MNPTQAGAGMRDLPLVVYEETIHVVNDKTTSEFVPTKYVVQADEAERITVTFCAKVVNQEESGSAVIAHYTTMIKSVQSLRDRIAVLHQFLCDVRSGKVDINKNGDQQILREIKGLCLRLPVMNQDKFRSDLLAVSRTPHSIALPDANLPLTLPLLCGLQEYNDALLVTYLSSMTKGTQLLSDVQEKFQVVHRDDTAGHYSAERRRGGMTDDDGMMMAGERRGRGAGREGGFMSNFMGSFGLG
jgi:COP9 signalosome complex subunit 6